MEWENPKQIGRKQILERNEKNFTNDTRIADIKGSESKIPLHRSR
jgi:hypothetical protein